MKPDWIADFAPLGSITTIAITSTRIGRFSARHSTSVTAATFRPARLRAATMRPKSASDSFTCSRSPLSKREIGNPTQPGDNRVCHRKLYTCGHGDWKVNSQSDCSQSERKISNHPLSMFSYGTPADRKISVQAGIKPKHRKQRKPDFCDYTAICEQRHIQAR